MNLLCFGLSILASVSVSWSAPTQVRVLKEIRATEKDQVTLEFDRSVEGLKIRTEFAEDSIQIQIPESSVFPAKIVPLEGDRLARIFAYQYAPKWMRVRINVKGTAASLRSTLDVKAIGKLLVIRAAAPTVVAAKSEVEEPKVVAALPVKSEKSAIVEHKVTGAKPSTNLTGNPGKDANPLKKSGVALLILLPILLMAWAYRRAKGKSQDWRTKTQKRGVELALGKMFGRKDRLIEVLDTQFFDPKRGIAVVRVRGREMVLGIADGAIQLLSEEESETQEKVADKSFESILQSDPTPGPSVLSGNGVKESVRDRIRSRTRELKVW